MNKEDYLAAMGKIDLKGAFPNGSLNARNFRVQWVRHLNIDYSYDSYQKKQNTNIFFFLSMHDIA